MGDASPAAVAGAGPALRTPGILRRIAGMAYEALLLAALLFLSTYVFLLFGAALDEAVRRPLLQTYSLAICGAYFIWLWRHGGQTLPMKTWRMRLIDAGGGPVSLRQAFVRYLLACLLVPLAGAAIIWAFFDRDRQFLHDRLAGTRLVTAAE
jgi:uncharacterized RDD family membrane protein YckC